MTYFSKCFCSAGPNVSGKCEPLNVWFNAVCSVNVRNSSCGQSMCGTMTMDEYRLWTMEPRAARAVVCCSTRLSKIPVVKVKRAEEQSSSDSSKKGYMMLDWRRRGYNQCDIAVRLRLLDIWRVGLLPCTRGSHGFGGLVWSQLGSCHN